MANEQIPDWMLKALKKDEQGEIPDWMKAALAADSPAADMNDGPDANNIDKSESAPALIRAEVGALDKPEDRLKALQKHYPDAKPYGADNFIYRDKEGKTRLYNDESWLPGLGDLASIAPEIGETLGAALGAAGGSVAGSVVPGPGTVAGGLLGAGAGSVAGREATQRGLNYLFQNEDSRTTGEQAKDAAQTFALGAAGEGAGRLVAKGASKAWDAGKRVLVGGPATDPLPVIQKRVEDMRALGIEPTPGMVTGSERQAVLEHATKTLPSGQVIEKRIKDAYAKQGNAFDTATGEMLGNNKPMTKAEIGEALKKQSQAALDAGKARSNELYAAVNQKITTPAVVNKTAGLLQSLNQEKSAFGKSDAILKGKQIDEVINLTSAIVEDGAKGVPFDQLKSFRTHVRELRDGTDDPVLTRKLSDLYGALSEDMEATAVASGPDALKAFKEANDHYRELFSPESFGKGGVSDKIIKAPDTDKIHDLIFNARKDGGNRIAAARRNIVKQEGGQQAWDDIGASFVQRLGIKSTNDGESFFDPTTFVKNWKDEAFSKEAKAAVFSGSKNAKYRDDLDRIARVAENLKRYGSHDNHSNTAKHQTALGGIFNKRNIFTAFLGAGAYTMDPVMLTATGVAAGANALAKRTFGAARSRMMASPEVVDWLASVPKAEMEKGGLRAHLGKLKQIGATSDNALAADINDYLRDLGYNEDQ